MNRKMMESAITHKCPISDYLRVSGMVLVIFLTMVAVKLIGFVLRDKGNGLLADGRERSFFDLIA